MKHWNRIWPTLAVSLLAVAAIAFQGDTKDWTRFNTRDNSLSLKLPKGWDQADMNSGNTAKFQKTMDSLSKENPKLATMMKANQSNESIKFIAYDYSDKDLSDGMDNISVTVNPNSDITESMYPEVTKQIMSRIPFKGKGESKIVELPVGKAIACWGAMEVQMDGSTLPMDLYGVFFVKNGKMFMVTVTVGKDGLKKNRGKIEQIMQTLTVS